MIQLKTIRELDDKTDEGKLLIAALAILTSIDTEDIKSGKWGGMTHPDEALDQIQDLANKIYFEEEWKSHQKSIDRDKKIIEVLNEESKY